jgi:hypothetical protein
MASTIKVNNIQNQCGANIANKCGSTITLGASGDTITLACGASQTGFGRTGTVDWDTTAKTASFTAVSGNGYFVNTTSGAITVTLPAGSAGSIVSLKDYANTWNTNNVTVTPNGTDKINGNNGDAILNTEDQSITLVYVDSTKGWRAVQDSTSDVTGAGFITATGGTVTCCGDYKIHTFTGPGTFTVSCAGNASGSNSVDYLVVAGGGSATFAGGGGAGGYRESSGAASGCYTASPLGACVSALPVTATGYPITVGGGGAGTAKPNSPEGTPGNNGSNSIFSSITSAGGGWGGVASPCGPLANNGNTGGSGGGGGVHRAACGGQCGSAGNTPPVSPPQGQPGGKGSYEGSTHTAGGGGGGAGGAGSNSPGGCSPQPLTPGGAGGTGVGTAINPSPTVGTPGPSGPLRYFAGGGRGGTNNSSPAPDQAASVGGGGSGNTGGGNTNGSNGTTNTGGGAGGGGEFTGTNTSGGSGIVIIRYKYQ